MLSEQGRAVGQIDRDAQHGGPVLLPRGLGQRDERVFGLRVVQREGAARFAPVLRGTHRHSVRERGVTGDSAGDTQIARQRFFDRLQVVQEQSLNIIVRHGEPPRIRLACGTGPQGPVNVVGHNDQGTRDGDCR